MKHLFLFLFFIPILCFGYDYPKSDGYHVAFNKDGSTRLSGGTTTQRMIDSRTWQSTPEYEKTSAWFNRTMSSGQGSLGNGAKVSGSVPVVLENSVNKKSVMQGLLKNARKGGSLLGKTTWQGVAFALVVDALYDASRDLRFRWDSDVGDFVTADAYIIVLHLAGKDYIVAGISAEQYSIGLSTFSSKVRSSCESFAPKVAKYYGHDSAELISFTTLEGKDPNSGPGNTGLRCDFQTNEGTLGLVFAGAKKNSVRSITQDEFDDIMIPIANPDPSSYVNASRDSQNGPIPGFSPVGHVLTSGASYNTGVYTDPADGKAKQTSVTVNSDGKTVSYSHTLRPDLQGDTDTAPIPTPLPDDEPKSETPAASVPVQCDIYPDSLGCVDVSDASAPVAPVVPEENVNLSFQPDNVFSNTGQCPAPEAFDAMGNTFSIDTTPLCVNGNLNLTPLGMNSAI